jgi:ribonuclease VapC
LATAIPELLYPEADGLKSTRPTGSRRPRTLPEGTQLLRNCSSPVVLDSSAILAVIFQEPGAEKVSDLLSGGLLSSVNLAEVHTNLVLRGVPPELIKDRIAEMGCEICLFDEEHAHLAGQLVAQTGAFGLSLGDRACLALAIQRSAATYTADRAWKNLNVGIPIEVIR